MKFKKVAQKVSFPEIEKEIMAFWEKNKVFEKSVTGKSKSKTFSFYDGPPFATGTPHYGHLLAGTIKDVIPRFKTMQGYRVERIWGWDTHGLPIENIVEQELDFKTKSQIEEYGVDKFNEKCRTKVLKYADEWKKIVARTGRWVDMENAYLTMDPKYMESVWWVVKTLYEKELIYEGHKVMPYCPRCATPLSNFEVGQGYQEKKDKAVTIKFELADEPGTYFLAWTTTPWTLPGNLALTVGKNIDYAIVGVGKEKYILASDRLSSYKKELGSYKFIKQVKGSELLGTSYKPIMPYYKNVQKAFLVIAGDFVTTEDGTGIVHTAPAFGEDDYRVSRANGIDFFMPVDDLGEFTIDVPDYAGQSVISPVTNDTIITDLGNKVIRVEDITHSYPYCWRCKTPLIYRGVASWFVAVKKFKKEAAALNKEIYWMPDKIGHARFAKMIESAPDWSISRNRFWGTPLPVWKCDKCHKVKVFGSRKELEDATGKTVADLHLHFVSHIEIPCECGGVGKLDGSVLDCWFESGSMPYGSIHYPFENKEKFKRDFPADFIAEGVDQTRGWFYSLLMLSTALYGKPSYRSVIVNGTVLADDGAKMSKSLNNYSDPMVVVNRYGADAMRFYMMAAPVVKGEDWSFAEKGVDEVVKKINLTLWNSYGFFTMYASLDGFSPKGKIKGTNILDEWLLSKTNGLILGVTEGLEKYDISNSARLLSEYIDGLSNWYIRRSRKRFWKSENDTDKNEAYETLYFALTTFVKLLAPFMPFLSEEVYRGLEAGKGKPISVHLADWPNADKKRISPKVEEEMELGRKIVEAGLGERNAKGIKVRQPLSLMRISSPVAKLPAGIINIISEEVNIKKLKLEKGSRFSVKLDTKITPELKAEGIARDFIRYIQDGRKNAGFEVENRINTYWETDDQIVAKAIESQGKFIAKETLSVDLTNERTKVTYEEVAKIDGIDVWFGITCR